MRKRMKKLNQNNTKGKKGRMLRSEEGDGGCCGRRGRIIIWLLPLRLSHYSSCRLSFHLHFFPQRGFESSAREVNILSTNQRFWVSCFLYFVLLGYGSTTQHGLQQHYSCSPPSLFLSQLFAFLPVYSCSDGVARRSGAGRVDLYLREVVKVVVVLGLDQLF